MHIDSVLAASGIEEERNVEACGGLRGRGTEDGERIVVFGIAAFGVSYAALDLKVGDRLEGIVLREGNPKMV
jgi:hypothetical protein